MAMPYYFGCFSASSRTGPNDEEYAAVRCAPSVYISIDPAKAGQSLDAEQNQARESRN